MIAGPAPRPRNFLVVLVLALALGLLLPGPASAAVTPDTIGLFRGGDPANSNTYFLRNKNTWGAPSNTIFGIGGAPGDQPLVGDWNGDGIVTIGLVRSNVPVGSNTVYLWNTNQIGPPDIIIESIGAVGDIFFAGDWDNNGTDTLALMRPNSPVGSNTIVFWNNLTNPPPAPDGSISAIGAVGDKPIAGKWNGAAASSIALLRSNDPAGSNTFFIWNTLPTTPPAAPDVTIAGIGAAGDLPLAGDWDGDGNAAIGLFRSNEPAGSTTFFLWNTNALTPPDITVFSYGASTDLPVTGAFGNSPPVIDPATFSIPENSANNTNVGTVVFSDPDNPDAGQTLTLAIVGGNTGTAFKINASTGQIQVNDSTALNFETTPTFNLTVQVSDNGTPPFSRQATVTVNLTNVVEAPQLTAGGTLSYTEDQVATAIDTGINITPGDSGNITGATVNITANCLNTEDVLSFANTATIIGTPGNCSLALNGTDTIANYILALRSVKYNNSSQNPSTAARTVTWQVTDGAANVSNTATSTINVAAQNDAPVLTVTGTLNYTEDQAATAIATTVNVTDPDSTNLIQATVTITGSCASGEDVLSFANTATIIGTPGSCSMTLNGSDTLANYITALLNVKYNNSSQNPSGLSRTVTWQVKDLTNVVSNTQLSTINVTPVNDAPTGVTNPANQGITGNVSFTAAVGLLLTGATDPEGNTPLSAKHPTGGNAATTTTQNGNVTVNADGSYFYNPPAGYEGADSFTFQVCDSLNACSANGTVNLTVGGMIWFVNNGAAGCTLRANGCGRLSNPYSTLAAFAAENNGALVTSLNPAINDNIFIYESGTDYSGPLTLLNGQRLIGQDATNTISEITSLNPPAGSTLLPATNSGAGAIVNITSASGNTVTLGSGNTLRGFTLGNNSAGAALAGTTFGTLTLANGGAQAADLKINNTTGQALNLNGGNIASAFHSITSSGGTNNVLLTNVTTTTTANLGSGALSGATAEALFITGQNGSFTYSGTITNVGGTRAVRIESKTGGTVTLSGNINPSVVGTAHGILAQNNSTGTNTIEFTGGEKKINTGAGTGVDLANNPGTTFNFTNGGLAITTTSGSGFSATGTTGTATVNVSGSNNTISTGTGTALNLNGTATGIIAGNIALADVTTAGAGAGLTHILLGNVSAPVNIAAGTLAGAPATTRAVDIGGGSGNFTYTGTINSGGIRAINRTGTSTLLFNGTSKILSAGTLAGVDFTGNTSGTTLTFSGGGLAITTTSGTGLNATANGTVNVSGSNNTITSPTGRAVNLSSVGGALTFLSVSSNSAAAVPGIVMANTTGSLTVTGDGGGSNNGSGGTISNKNGAFITGGTPGVHLTTVQNVQLNYMNITGNNHSGIKGSGVNGFKLNRCIISNNGNTGGEAQDESGVDITELTGTASAGANPTSITNCTFNENFEFQIQITNTTGTLTDLQMSGNTISSTGAGGVIGNLFNFLALGTANMTLNLTSGTFTGNAPATATGAQCDHSGTGGTMTCNMSGATFTDNNVGPQASVAAGGSMVADFNGVTATGNRSHGINFFLAADSSGTFTAKARNSTVGTLGVAGSGSDLGFGIRVQNESSNTTNPTTVLITGNTVQEMTNFAAVNVNQGIAGQGSSRTSNVTITNNTLQQVDNSRAIIVQQNNSTDVDSAGSTCVDISGNEMNNIAGNIGDGTKIRLRQLDANGGDMNVRQLTPTAAVIANELDDANSPPNGVAATTTTTAQISLSGSIDFNTGACPTPP